MRDCHPFPDRQHLGSRAPVITHQSSHVYPTGERDSEGETLVANKKMFEEAGSLHSLLIAEVL